MNHEQALQDLTRFIANERDNHERERANEEHHVRFAYLQGAATACRTILHRIYSYRPVDDD